MTVEAVANQPTRRRMRRSGLVVTVAAVLFTAACTGSDSDAEAVDATDAPSAVPSVVATTGIWADVVSNVGCDDSVSVTTLIPQGGDPHTYEPSLRDRETMDAADLVVANGLGLEERLEDTLEAVTAEGVHVFEVAEHIDTIEFEFSGGHDDHGHGEEDGHDDHDEEDGHDDHDEEDGHDHDEEDGHDDHDEEDGHDDHDEEDGHDDHDEEDGHDDHDDHAGHDHSGGDPHVWFDLQRVAGVLGELADELIHAGADADTVNGCLDAYREALAEADAEVAGILDAVPADRRIMITNHDVFGYFADRYGFEVVGTVIPSLSTTAETNPALLEELAEIIEHEGVPAVFSETTHSDVDIQALATAAGDISVVQLLTGSLAPAGEDGDTLIGMLRFNAQAIADALG
ncbi:metal ABC transporter substrate-binding protein [Candidatus Poriferisodalis multihospitum]|uniref:metal ABC transporter substrate-binding protein n=1 Tax=Candidatus Poriferisodalis multihospitum TaxID=2983191 RepID=UPI002B258C30|nr:metal ABC transporter substrate-binding protein [Candidatus Poriferisodalis multihospitum]